MGSTWQQQEAAAGRRHAHKNRFPTHFGFLPAYLPTCLPACLPTWLSPVDDPRIHTHTSLLYIFQTLWSGANPEQSPSRHAPFSSSGAANMTTWTWTWTFPGPGCRTTDQSSRYLGTCFSRGVFSGADPGHATCSPHRHIQHVCMYSTSNPSRSRIEISSTQVDHNSTVMEPIHRSILHDAHPAR